MGVGGEYLLTRVMAPSPQAGAIRRERLLRRLDETSRHPVTLVVAPAGFGKTVLAQSWLAEPSRADKPHAWVSLGGEAGDAFVFLGYLVRALGRAGLAPDCHTAQMLSRVNAPDAIAITSSLINDVASLNREITLVLDDFHAAESEQVDRLTLFLMDNQPPNLRCLVLTRVTPRWPLTSMTAYGKLATIVDDDLRFNDSEIRELARGAALGEIGEEEAGELADVTEGWPAALRLCLTRARRPGGRPGRLPGGMPGARPEPVFAAAISEPGYARSVVDRLLDEFLDGAAPDVREFLRATAPVENLCPALCTYLLGASSPEGGPPSNDSPASGSSENTPSAGTPSAGAPPAYDVAEMVERVSRDGLQLTSVGDGGGAWFRYHHLLRSRLMARLRADGVDVTGTYRRASEWFEGQGVVSEQVRYAIASQDWAFASSVVMRSALWAILTGRFSMLRDWMAGIPARETLPHPALCFAAALVPSLAGSYARRAEVESMCGRLEQFALLGAGDRELFGDEASCEGLACLLRANLFMVPDATLDPGEHLALALRAQRLLGVDSPLTGPIYQHIGCAELALGRYDEAREAFEEGLRRAEGNDDVCVTAETGAFLVDLDVEQGRYAEALGRIRRLKERAASLVGANERASEGETGTPPALGVLDIMHGRILLEQGREHEAERLIERGIALSHGSCVPYFTMMGDIELARVRFAAGRVLEAKATLDDLEESWDELGFVVEALRGELSAGPGGDGTTAGPEGGGATSSAASPATCAIRDALLPATLPGVGFSGGAQARWEAAVAALRTIARDGDGDQVAESLSLVDSAIAHYEGCGLAGRVARLKQVRTRMRARAEQAGGQGERRAGNRAEGQAGRQTRGQADKRGARPPVVETEAGTPVQLTGRELDVLRLAADGLSNQEISDRLFIGVTTTKTHMAHVMQKLSGPNRATAVARAREYGLIK